MDSIDLIMSERSGVEIDYCPQCRGVWLDRGELDKIIDRAAEMGTGQAPVPPPAPMAPGPGIVPPPLYNIDPRIDPRRDERSQRRPEQPRYDDRGHDRNYGKGYDRDYDRRRPKKKEGWLGDLFDF